MLVAIRKKAAGYMEIFGNLAAVLTIVSGATTILIILVWNFGILYTVTGFVGMGMSILSLVASGFDPRIRIFLGIAGLLAVAWSGWLDLGPPR